jgi:hypothetical protein
MDDKILDRVIALKADAKSARDDGAWPEARAYLDEAIDFMRELGASTASPNWLSVQLADVYGLIGGIEKRWGLPLAGQERKEHLTASVAAYDQGFGYEKDLQPADANTYNRVNRLVGRVLLDPSVLEPGSADSAEVAEGLEAAEKIVTEEISSTRRKDPWAYCDLGTIQLLRGEAEEALSVFYRLVKMRPQDYVYESALETLEPLRDAASEIRPELVSAVELLQKFQEPAY